MEYLIVLSYIIIGIVGAYYLHPKMCDLFWHQDLHRDGYKLGEFIMASASWIVFWPFHILIFIGMLIANMKIMDKNVR